MDLDKLRKNSEMKANVFYRQYIILRNNCNKKQSTTFNKNDERIDYRETRNGIWQISK